MIKIIAPSIEEAVTLRLTTRHELVLIPPTAHKQSDALKGIGPDVVYSRRDDKAFRTRRSAHSTQKHRNAQINHLENNAMNINTA